MLESRNDGFQRSMSVLVVDRVLELPGAVLVLTGQERLRRSMWLMERAKCAEHAEWRQRATGREAIGEP